MNQETKKICLACDATGIIYGWQGGSFSKRLCSLCNGEKTVTVEQEKEALPEVKEEALGEPKKPAKKPTKKKPAKD